MMYDTSWWNLYSKEIQELLGKGSSDRKTLERSFKNWQEVEGSR